MLQDGFVCVPCNSNCPVKTSANILQIVTKAHQALYEIRAVATAVVANVVQYEASWMS